MLRHPTLPLVLPHLLGAQGQPPFSTIYADDFYQQLFTGVDNIGGGKLWRTEHLTGVEQAFHSKVQLDKSAKIQHAGDTPLDQLIRLVTIIYQSPGIRLEPLEAERDPFPLPVYTEHVNGHLLANFENLARIVHPPPTEFRNVDQTISPTQVYESAKIGDAGDLAVPHLSLGQLIHNPIALPLLPGAQRPPLRKDQTATAAVHFDDPETYLLPDHIRQPLAPILLRQPLGQIYNLRGRDKTLNFAKIDNETTPIMARYLALVEITARHHLLGLDPIFG